MNNGVSRELIEEKFSNTNERIEATNDRIQELKDAIEKLAEAMVTSERFNSHTIKIEQIQKMTKEQEKRLGKAEHYISASKYIGGLVAGIIVVLVTLWLSGVLGV